MSTQQVNISDDDQIRKVVEINGQKVVITGTVSFNVAPVVILPEPPKPTEPEIDPSTGTIKEGSRWSKNPGKAETWQAVQMENDNTKWKLIAQDKLNVIADLPSKEYALALQEYFKTNPFPPKVIVEPPEPTDPDTKPDLPPVVEGQVIDGVQLPYAITGKFKLNDFHWNKRKDGLRCDHEGLEVGEYVNSVMVFYGTFVGEIPDDEIAFKWSWGSHSGKGALVKCYGIRMKNKSGETDYRMEWEHPEYTEPLAKGEKGITPKNGVSLGYAGVRKTLSDGTVLLEYWQDEGGLVNGKPANKWKKKLSFIDKEYKVTDYPKGIECTVRIDDKKGWENVKVDKVLLAELKP